jgi:hypothetical protein
MRRVK